MRKSFMKKAIVTAVLTSMVTSTISTTAFSTRVMAEENVSAVDAVNTANTGTQLEAYDNATAALQLTETARFNSGMTNADGGVMEIVDYNTATGWAYAINGQTGHLTAIAIKDIEKSTDIDLLDGNNIDIKSIIENEVTGFKYGDMTSVAVSPDNKTIAVAIQAEDYFANGRVAVFECNADGTLTFKNAVEVGVQPDMVTYTPNGTMILTANEGEPRLGYAEGTIDPAGSVSIIKTSDLSADTVGFEAFDEKRAELVSAGIVIKKNTNPSVDFEPEYIAATDTKAYITLQEANAVAVLDLAAESYSGIYSAGFEDYSTTAIDIDKKDEKYAAKTYSSLMGIRMPDSIAVYTAAGQDYIVTANEGDSRDWNGYLNELEVNFGKGKTSPTGAITAENSGLAGKVVFFDPSDYEGLSSEKDYLFGGRSFTVYKVTDNGIVEVYTSGNELEAKTATLIPDNFNCSNDDKTIDDRSGKKGVEAESVTVGVVGEKTYAFVGLERIGGVMVYDITDSANVSYVNYINSRDFSEDIAGDVSPEGLCFIPASESKTGKPMLLAACEVSGTVAVYDITEVKKDDTDNNGGTTDNEEETDKSAGTESDTAADEVQDNASSEVATDKVDTGDNAPVVMLIVIALLSAGIFAVSLNGKLKKREA